MEWNAEEALETIRHGGRFGKKRIMEAVYRSNAEVFRDWGYRLPSGRVAGLGDRDALLARTEVRLRPFDVLAAPSRGRPPETGCANADCVDVAEELLGAGFDPAVLNLASRIRPCGGYDRGLGAQEESLCRVSTLSQSLYQFGDPKRKCVRDAGVPHRADAYPLDIRFGGIHSPGVVFFRRNAREGYAFREAPFACGVVTVAALSFREPNDFCADERGYMAPGGGFTPEGDAVQLDKIRTIFRLALAHGHDAVVLGAFGCGVNRLPPDAVADQFGRVLVEPEFENKFRAVVFAILEGPATARRPVEEQGKYAPFYEHFGRWAERVENRPRGR
ncbi:MAG: TIGR02452 family protein [Kiritimatiellae bacterium]|nr:TIGR02452 family protein [Kiritimatiellia bacterium]